LLRVKFTNAMAAAMTAATTVAAAKFAYSFPVADCVLQVLPSIVAVVNPFGWRNVGVD